MDKMKQQSIQELTTKAKFHKLNKMKGSAMASHRAPPFNENGAINYIMDASLLTMDKIFREFNCKVTALICSHNEDSLFSSP